MLVKELLREGTIPTNKLKSRMDRANSAAPKNAAIKAEKTGQEKDEVEHDALPHHKVLKDAGFKQTDRDSDKDYQSSQYIKGKHEILVDSGAGHAPSWVHNTHNDPADHRNTSAETHHSLAHHIRTLK